MINLLPNNYKEQIVYGRKNLVLTHWIIAMFMAMAAILASVVCWDNFNFIKLPIIKKKGR